MNRKTGKKNKQSINNKIISGFNSFKYLLIEPVKLILARKKYEAGYMNSSEKPLISVYIPTYNRAKILVDRAIPSVLNQTYRNFELIIVGDSCTDDTEKLILDNADPRIRFYNLQKRTYRYPPTAENHWLAGPVVPANTALGLVRGKWIARLDDDDTWTDDHLELLLNFAEKGNYEFVSASYIAERHGNKIIVDASDENPRIGGTQTWLYRSYLDFFRYNINCWRKSWNRVNDTDLQDRMFKAGVRMGFLDRVVAHVLPRPGEATIGLEAYRLNEDEKIRHFAF
jgi:glycosyltransferase involved in cell wall biosynthesis